MKISYEEFRMYADNYDGYCPDCDDITTGQVEPDAHGRECARCGQHRVVGLEDAMMMGDVEIAD